jgi:transcription antitermination factor NusB
MTKKLILTYFLMKTIHDPRHQKRIDALKVLFAQTFTAQPSIPELAKAVIAQQNVLDQEIVNAAPSWPIEKINKIDLAILRLAVFELRNTQTPPKVIIDEAVELAKEYGAESSPGFVNGVLGTLFQVEEPNHEQ